MDSYPVHQPIRKIVVVGGGSAGFMAALTLVKRLPAARVEVVHSPDIPVIGVGESTTVAIPRFLHDELGIDRREFFRAVEPSWKLGLRLEFGVPEVTHFNRRKRAFSTACIAGTILKPLSARARDRKLLCSTIMCSAVATRQSISPAPCRCARRCRR